MKTILLSDIQKYLTPYKLGRPVLTGSGLEGAFDSGFVDIPFVFLHNEMYFMMYTGYNTAGYQTALARSTDLINWEHYGIILKTSDEQRWDSISAGGTWIMKESCDLMSPPTLKKVDGRYWLAYHAYPRQGFEEGPAEIGLAWTTDENLLDWHRLKKPVLSWKDGGKWERGGLYKACLFCWKDKYYLFYNAKNEDKEWIEQTGMAVSEDLLNWTRCQKNPLICVEPDRWDSRFVSDPCIYRDNGIWLNFYFGFDNRHAQEGLAYSSDLVHWQKIDSPIITHGRPGELDAKHAHKASVIVHDGAIYHFYCSVRDNLPGDKTSVYGEYRTITVACSKPWPQTQQLKEGVTV